MSKKMKFGRYDYADFLMFIAYACCSVVIPVSLSPLSREMNFPLSDGGMGLGGLLQVGRSGMIVIMLAVSGFAAARLGICKSLGLALTLMSAGILAVAAAPVYGILLVALAFAGLGEGIIEGLGTPVVQNLHPEEPGRYINFTHSFWSVGVLGMGITAGLLLSWGVSWRIVAAGAGVLGLIPALIFLLPGNYPERKERQSVQEVLGHAKKIVKNWRFWVYFAAMFVAGGGEYGLTFWLPSYVCEDCGGTLFQAGLSAAFFSAGMVAGRMGAGYLVRQKKLKALLAACAAGAMIVCLIFPFVRIMWILFVLLFVTGVAVGPFWPSIQSYCSTRMKADTTMLFILLSCSGVPGSGFFALLMGYLGDRMGLKNAFLLVVPACFLLIGVLVGADWLIHRRELSGRLIRQRNKGLQAD